MRWLIGKGSATLWIAVALLATGSFIGYRLTRDYYLATLARQAQRFATERQQLREAAAQSQIQAEQRVINFERQETIKLAEIDRQYQQELQYEKAKADRILAQSLTAHQLYINVKPTADGHNRLSTASTGSGIAHDQTRAELSTTAARFLIREASRADQIVRQLTACQQVIQAERTVNGRR